MGEQRVTTGHGEDGVDEVVVVAPPSRPQFRRLGFILAGAEIGHPHPVFDLMDDMDGRFSGGSRGMVPPDDAAFAGEKPDTLPPAPA
jgi:hypothetical protein